MDDFDVIIGYEDEKQELKRICDTIRNPQKYREFGVVVPRGLLIKGKPGLGKTLMAKTFIAASGRKVFCCRKDKLNGDFVNEIRTVFENAKKEAPSIVFLDDLDKFANEDIYHKNAEEFVTVQSCIDSCNGTEVFVIATANLTNSIPISLLRANRFDRVLQIKTPGYTDALKIIEFYLCKKRYVANIDIAEITKLLGRRSCAELETVIAEAGIYAGFDGRERIEMDDIVKAFLRVILDLNEDLNFSFEYAKKVAYHEAGHVVVSECLEPGSVNLASIAAHNSDIRGICSYLVPEDRSYNSIYMQNKVMRYLAGKAAFEMTFGGIDAGAADDMRKVSDLLEWFISRHGMFGLGLFARDSVGDDIKTKKNIVIEIEMERLYSETKNLLANNREFLEEIVKALLVKKTLLRKDIAEIKREMYIPTR